MRVDWQKKEEKKGKKEESCNSGTLENGGNKYTDIERVFYRLLTPLRPQSHPRAITCVART